MALKVPNFYSPNFDPKKRSKKSIKFIIIHYTGMTKESSAIKKLSNPSAKVSCHYFIKKNGQIIRMVPDLYVAWHAGVSEWKNYKLLNKNSIGIELQNPGHENKYKNFTSNQLNNLINLLLNLKKKYNIKKENILGHSDIAPDRKKDPGEKFPWKKLSEKNLCLWSKLKSDNLLKLRNIHVLKKDYKLFLIYLKKIGYKISRKLPAKKSEKFLIVAFQRKYRNALINGKVDHECLLIAKNLIY